MTNEDKNLLVKDPCGSQYRPFGFYKKDLKGIIEPKSNEYCCPNCGTELPDDDEGYVVDGKLIRNATMNISVVQIMELFMIGMKYINAQSARHCFISEMDVFRT